LGFTLHSSTALVDYEHDEKAAHRGGGKAQDVAGQLHAKHSIEINDEARFLALLGVWQALILNPPQGAI